jgi:DNA-directed RNA polymerase specialized sigma24 family protein
MRRVGTAELVVADADALWSLLCAVALNKVRENVRFHHREKRRVARSSSGDAALGHLTTREPGPGDIAAFHDGVAHALAALDAEERRVLEMRLAGATHGEIAAALACSERTIRRISVRLEERILSALGDEQPAPG